MPVAFTWIEFPTGFSEMTLITFSPKWRTLLRYPSTQQTVIWISVGDGSLSVYTGLNNFKWIEKRGTLNIFKVPLFYFSGSTLYCSPLFACLVWETVRFAHWSSQECGTKMPILVLASSLHLLPWRFSHEPGSYCWTAKYTTSLPWALYWRIWP